MSRRAVWWTCARCETFAKSSGMPQGWSIAGSRKCVKYLCGDCKDEQKISIERSAARAREAQESETTT
jgi:hypothetical protein